MRNLGGVGWAVKEANRKVKLMLGKGVEFVTAVTTHGSPTTPDEGPPLVNRSVQFGEWTVTPSLPPFGSGFLCCGCCTCMLTCDPRVGKNLPAPIVLNF